MNRRLLVFALIVSIVTVVAACNKDKFQTRPSLTLTSLNSDFYPTPESEMLIEFEFTDKEGDLTDSIFFRKVRLNKRKVPTIRDTISVKIPPFPKNTQGFIQLRMKSGDYLESAQNPPIDPITNKRETDTLMMYWALRDQAGNKSDTVAVGPIYVVRQQ